MLSCPKVTLIIQCSRQGRSLRRSINDYLAIGKELEYRIIAVNKAGDSEPSNTAMVVL